MLNQKFWKKYFESYDILNNLIPYSELIQDIWSELNPTKGDKILDAGSGTGNLSVLIAGIGAETFSLDYSEAGIAVHKSKDKNAQTILHDINQKLPFPDNFFDKLASNNVLYTIPRENRARIFSEFYRVLKPGGKAVIANLSEGFSPFAIYKYHISKCCDKYGFLETIYRLVLLIVPTIKIFYYNYVIKKENKSGAYDFFLLNEQYEEFKKAGFSEISQTKIVYAGQSVLNFAIK